jgi:hypothetical protein
MHCKAQQLESLGFLIRFARAMRWLRRNLIEKAGMGSPFFMPPQKD